ncbi:MAG: 16S rRNA (guanine(527)-N(7))-methyltransferase RsmG [Puniceicoccaceae bacterium]|mgnify:FL=1|nr:16S rRNA (guanine(527)-N(7))-methyltransferase RsmG [Puniceicoccaceae bacterium]|tara:strand:- start:83 stop:727 length:645 start_codon:yes stop_codon:yes gene_type:complete
MKLAALKDLFPHIHPEAWFKLEYWCELLSEWNEKINLISRKDIDALAERHLVHCLAVTNILQIKGSARILDVGTGGGLPGLPMAICYPQAQFTLIDSVGKKIKAVQSIANTLGLKNVRACQMRAEQLGEHFDFITGRAVKNLPEFLSWIQNNARKGHKHSLANGLLYWKGGAYSDELAPTGYVPNRIYDLEKMLKNPYFCEKYILHFHAEGFSR